MKVQRAVLVAASIVAATVLPPAAEAASLDDFKQIVVIYQENHSFDNLYGLWGTVEGKAVDGLPNADPAHTTQVRQDDRTPYSCLLQNDVNLVSPPLPAACTDSTGAPFQSAFRNEPFDIDEYIKPAATTCPVPGTFAPHGMADGKGLLGGCTRDLVHRFYNEQYQINRGNQNRYVTGSDAAGLVMGHYDTTRLPIYRYLHRDGAPHYVIADRFFQAAFGGSFLNHQWLVAAATPVFAGAANDGGPNDLHAIVDVNGMPASTPLYTSPLGLSPNDPSTLSASCNPPAGRPATPAGIVCGDWAVNTMQPFHWPFAPGTPDARRLPPLSHPTIGDRLNDAGVDWAWYSGGWSNANGDIGAPGWTNGNGPTCGDPNADPRPGFPRCPDKLFQYHHQALNYFAAYAPGTPSRRDHLRDEVEFIASAKAGSLKPVSFVKPVGEENEHPGYASQPDGNDHLVALIDAVINGPQGQDTLVIVTYDEFGGQWDHVPPPPNGRADPGQYAHDQWGPGTRIPALLIAKRFTRSAVDRTDAYDTTSILKLIEDKYRLPPLTPRDKAARSLRGAVEAAN